MNMGFLFFCTCGRVLVMLASRRSAEQFMAWYWGSFWVLFAHSLLCLVDSLGWHRISGDVISAGQ